MNVWINISIDGGHMRFIGYGAIAILLASQSVGVLGQATPNTLPPTPSAPAEQTLSNPLSTTPEDVKKYGSLYLRCDGQPNNITGMESFARLMGALTLLALFAPSPEQPDPSKRLFGEKGIAACTELLENPKQETNVLRRIPLILARAAHWIEAKNYQAALTDIDMARGEAKALNLIGNPYFDRSMGLSFDLLEAHTRTRLRDFSGARDVGLRNSGRMPYSVYANITAYPANFANHDLNPEEEAYYRSGMKISPKVALYFANRLDEVGRYSEAAEVRLGYGQLTDNLVLNDHRSWPMAQAAVSYALAGEWAMAADNAAAAKANLDARAAAGKPENDQSSVVENLDLYKVILLAHEGRMTDARRNFAARSEWTAPSFGAISAVTARLREGARPEELFGALEISPETLWAKRLELALARYGETDTNNKALFTYLLPFAKISDFERLSSNVWRSQKSRLISDKEMEDSKFWSVSIWSDAMTQPDALLLHTANLAKARGFEGFAFFPNPSRPEFAWVMFANAGDPAIPARHFVNADEVIAELRQIIPSPEEMKARKALRR